MVVVKKGFLFIKDRVMIKYTVNQDYILPFYEVHDGFHIIFSS